MEKEQFRLNPMLPRRYSSRQRAEIRKKEKEILEGINNEESTKKSKPKVYTKTRTEDNISE